jgi:hypothetical protein
MSITLFVVLVVISFVVGVWVGATWNKKGGIVIFGESWDTPDRATVIKLSQDADVRYYLVDSDKLGDDVLLINKGFTGIVKRNEVSSGNLGDLYVYIETQVKPKGRHLKVVK